MWCVVLGQIQRDATPLEGRACGPATDGSFGNFMPSAILPSLPDRPQFPNWPRWAMETGVGQPVGGYVDWPQRLVTDVIDDNGVRLVPSGRYRQSKVTERRELDNHGCPCLLCSGPTRRDVRNRASAEYAEIILHLWRSERLDEDRLHARRILVRVIQFRHRSRSRPKG